MFSSTSTIQDKLVENWSMRSKQKIQREHLTFEVFASYLSSDFWDDLQQLKKNQKNVIIKKIFILIKNFRIFSYFKD